MLSIFLFVSLVVVLSPAQVNSNCKFHNIDVVHDIIKSEIIRLSGIFENAWYCVYLDTSQQDANWERYPNHSNYIVIQYTQYHIKHCKGGSFVYNGVVWLV